MRKSFFILAVLFSLVYVQNPLPAYGVWQEKNIVRMPWGQADGEVGFTRNNPAGIPVGPSDFTVDSSGEIYVADYVNHRIVKYNKDGQFVSGFGQKYDTIDKNINYEHISIDGDDNIYCFDGGNGNIIKFMPSGKVKVVVEEKSRAIGIKMNVNKSGDIYVTGIRGSKKYIKNEKSALFGLFKTGEEEYSAQDSKYILDSPNGNSYVVERKGGMSRFQMIKKAKTEIAQKEMPLSYDPEKGDRFIGFDGAGNYYVADYHFLHLRKYDPNGNLSDETDLPSKSQMQGQNKIKQVKVDNSGNIYCFIFSNKEAWIVKMEKTAK